MPALTGCTAVIDVSNVKTTSAKKATAFFEASSRNLLAVGTTSSCQSSASTASAWATLRLRLRPSRYYSPKRTNRSATLIVPAVYTLTRVASMVSESSIHYLLGSLVEIGLLLGIIRTQFDATEARTTR